jgi:putative ABC transport system permease protein
MKTRDLIRTALSNIRHAKARTLLTVLAIFVGALTLTITNGLGAGINHYIDDTVASFGASDVLTVTKPSDQDTPGNRSNTDDQNTDDQDSDDDDDVPTEYDPDAVAAGQAGPMQSNTVTALTQTDIDTIADIDGVEDVEPAKSIDADYIQYEDGTKYVADVGTLIPGQDIQLAAGAEPDNDATDYQITLPVNYVDPLGFEDNADAIDSTIRIVLTDGDHKQQSVSAKIVGIAEQTLNPTGASTITTNDALTDRLYDVQSVGLPDDEKNKWAQANVWFSNNATDQDITALQDRLEDEGYDSTTVEEQLGSFRTVIDTIILVLNGFAVIALITAGFGIVNTLLMSVQERTREIGLMKAMGMRSGRVFALFSLEAAFIGLLGSLIGVIIASIVGTVASTALSERLLADLPGLSLFAFDPVDILGTIALIVVVAFLAGTIPAARAAAKDPVEALRYE